MRPDTDAPKDDYPGRDPPRRYIDKREGVRHVLHAAIRSVLNEEDPFAIHLLCQSAEKVLIDLLEKQGSTEPLSLIIPVEKRRQWFSIHRETYNFLKHADRDSDDRLGVHNIVASNDLLLLACIIRFGLLFGPYTRHMSAFMIFADVLYPMTNSVPAEVKPLLRDATPRALTRGELTSVIRHTMEQNALSERTARGSEGDTERQALADSTSASFRPSIAQRATDLAGSGRIMRAQFSLGRQGVCVESELLWAPPS
jgi:hypothetical protein